MFEQAPVPVDWPTRIGSNPTPGVTRVCAYPAGGPSCGKRRHHRRHHVHEIVSYPATGRPTLKRTADAVFTGPDAEKLARTAAWMFPSKRYTGGGKTFQEIVGRFTSALNRVRLYERREQEEEEAAPTLDLGNDYTLMRKSQGEPSEHKGATLDHWELHHPIARGEPLGSFKIGRYPANFSFKELAGRNFVSDATVTAKHRRKGLGTRAYRALADHYGSLESNLHHNTSSGAKFLWKRLASRHGAEPFEFAGKTRYRLPGRAAS